MFHFKPTVVKKIQLITVSALLWSSASKLLLFPCLFRSGLWFNIWPVDTCGPEQAVFEVAADPL